MDLTTEEKIQRAKIQIQKRNSFFAYLSLFMKFQESKDLPDYAGMGVNVKGDCFYKKEFVDKLTDEELQAVITHEILHLALLHLIRRGNRNPEVWNLTTDTAVNYVLKENGFRLPDGCIIPDSNNEVTFFGQTLTDCDKKSAEELYDDLKIPEQKKLKIYVKELQDGSGKDGKKSFDIHIEGEEKMTEKEKKKIKDEWLGKIQEAVTISKMKGDLPRGMERLIEGLHKEQIDWKSLLYNYISQQIPYNHSYNYPHKKSVSSGVYMPNILKEKVDVVIGIDVSGSVGQKELSDFLSEIIGIARAFQDRIDMRLITHETEVTNDYMVRNGNIEKIKKMKIEGGGGTSHIQPFEYVKDKARDCKVVIWLTDGYSDLNQIDFNNYQFENLFVINNDGTDEQIKDKRCRIIKLKE